MTLYQIILSFISFLFSLITFCLLDRTYEIEVSLVKSGWYHQSHILWKSDTCKCVLNFLNDEQQLFSKKKKKKKEKPPNPLNCTLDPLKICWITHSPKVQGKVFRAYFICPLWLSKFSKLYRTQRSSSSLLLQRKCTLLDPRLQSRAVLGGVRGVGFHSPLYPGTTNTAFCAATDTLQTCVSGP